MLASPHKLLMTQPKRWEQNNCGEPRTTLRTTLKFQRAFQRFATFPDAESRRCTRFAIGRGVGCCHVVEGCEPPQREPPGARRPRQETGGRDSCRAQSVNCHLLLSMCRAVRPVLPVAKCCRLTGRMLQLAHGILTCETGVVSPIRR